jgi:MtN3 and saliva related transmembrane protein
MYSPLATLIGYIAAVVGTCIMIPQIVKFIRTKRADDVSMGMAVLYFFNCALWLIYGCLIVAPPVILANGIGLLISIVQIFLKRRYSVAK